jgi:hypothetical protein
MLSKTFSAPASIPSCNKQQQQLKNTSSASKNQNKCFIKDINKSINEKETMLAKVMSEGKMDDSTALLQLERIVNYFDMSLLFTINGLMNDNAFTLNGQRMKFLHLHARPSLERFNEVFDGEKIDNCVMESVDLSVVESNQIQLQMHVKFNEKATNVTRYKRLNVIFMAKYERDGAPCDETATTKDTFFVYFTSFFEV